MIWETVSYVFIVVASLVVLFGFTYFGVCEYFDQQQDKVYVNRLGLALFFVPLLGSGIVVAIILSNV